MIRLIGITGYAGSGKSTAAKHLVACHGFTLIKFAGPLKAMLNCLGLGESEIEGDLKERPSPILGGKTPRHAMQTLGSEWGRDLIHPDLWVNVAMESVAAVLDQGGKVVLDDCRFENETRAITEFGGRIVHIDRPGVGAINEHLSERYRPAPDYLITNDKSEVDFLREVDLLAGLYSLVTEKEPCV